MQQPTLLLEGFVEVEKINIGHDANCNYAESSDEECEIWLGGGEVTNVIKSIERVLCASSHFSPIIGREIGCVQ